MLEPNTKITLDVEPGKEIWLAGNNVFSFEDDKDRLITIRDGELGVDATPVFQIEGAFRMPGRFRKSTAVA